MGLLTVKTKFNFRIDLDDASTMCKMERHCRNYHLYNIYKVGGSNKKSQVDNLVGVNIKYKHVR